DEYPKASWAADALERLLALDEAAGRWEDVVDRLRLRAKAAAAAERADWQARLAEALIAQAFSETAKGQTDTNARRQGSATADFDAAAKICRSALEQVDLAAAGEAPEAGRRHKLSLLRAQCAEGQGELEKAISLYDAAAADDPSLSNEAAYRAAMVESPVPGRRDAPTLSRCRQALQRVRPRLVDDPCGQGMLLALDLALAETGFFLKQYDKSIEEFRWVIDHNPVTAKQERAQFFTGQVYFHTKRFTEAMGEYAKLDRARDADIAADVYLHRGRALIALGGFSEMGSWIKGQEGRFPAGAESLHLLWAEGLYAAKRYQDALGVCEQFISMTEEGRQVRAIWLHAAVLTALGRRDEARQMALKLRESHPDWRETAEALLLLVAGLAKGRR
ncbi:MAG TPA: tetratricopeptide repeat protein, partial [Armatimonadota bacterium]